MATNIGTVIEGKYEILKLIGTGGMSYAYLAMDKRLNKQWAVKEIKKTANGKNDEIIENSLLTEANLMKKLDHPALPRIVDVVQVNMAKITKKKSFVLEKAVVYYQIKSDISIPPLMLNLQINKGESAYNLNTLCDYEYKNIAGY